MVTTILLKNGMVVEVIPMSSDIFLITKQSVRQDMMVLIIPLSPPQLNLIVSNYITLLLLKKGASCGFI